MAIKCTRNDIVKELERMKNIIHDHMINSFQLVGETCIKLIRDRSEGKPNWTDRSGNLRSSIGYILFVDGEPFIDGGFNLQSNKGNNPFKGINIGSEYAEKLGLSISERYVLVVVAGMNYASYVEKKDYDVIAFVEADARKQAEKLLKGLKL